MRDVIERDLAWLPATGEMSRLIRSYDWCRTPLGPLEQWPQSLRTAAGLMLASKGPVSILWGAEHIQLYNDAYITVAADRHPAALGQPAAQAWDDAFEPFLGPVFDRVLAGETVEVDEHEVTLRSPLGELVTRYFTASFLPIADDKGGVAGIFHPLTEATEQVSTRKALRQREERLQRVLDGMAEGFGLLAPDFTILEQNAEALRMDGRPREEIIGRSHWEVFPGSEHSELGRLLRRAMTERVPVLLEHRHIWNDGHAGWLEMRAYPTSDGTLAVFWRDVTDRKAAEEQLQESEARLRALTNNLPAGMVYQIATGAGGSDRRFLYVSQSHEKLTGVPADAVLADPTIPYRLIEPEDRDRLAQAELRAIRDKAPFEVEVRFRRADGETRWCRIISAPREQQDGSLIWDGIQIDTTDQKIVEAALRELNDTLEERVAARTTELEHAHEQLRQSQKLEAMGNLTGGVAHDFNNLLSPIIGSLDLLLKRGVGNQREQRLIEGALQSAERARVLVQRLLAFARRQPLQSQPVDIGELVKGMADLVASTTGPQVKVVVDISDPLPAAVADSNQIEMALLNLSVNARDAMPHGGTLRLSVDSQEVGQGHRTGLNPGRYLRLSVADTGVGMTDETLKRAIEPFFSTKGLGRGTGLGLSMVHGLAAQLGGGLTIKSAPDAGTTVEMWLPASERKAIEVNDGATAEDHGGAGTILLVDDEELVRSSTAAMLLDLGYAVIEAGSAEEALQMVERDMPFDILVTDHLMPGMTGTELAKTIAKRRPDARILVISGYAEVDGIAPDLSRLTKPFRQAELGARLRELEEAEARAGAACAFMGPP